MFMARLNNWLVRVEITLAFSLLAFIILATTIQVIWRAVLGDPLSWTEEAVRLAFVWVVYVGVIRAVRKRTHISVDFFVRLLPDYSQLWIARANHLLYVAFFTVFFVQAIRLMLHTSKMSLAVLPLPAAAIYLAGVVCGAMSLIHLALQWPAPDAVPRTAPC
jgi:TRAP-type C4-dicarboxylate transport system permease small subunit